MRDTLRVPREVAKRGFDRVAPLDDEVVISQICDKHQHVRCLPPRRGVAQALRGDRQRIGRFRVAAQLDVLLEVCRAPVHNADSILCACMPVQQRRKVVDGRRIVEEYSRRLAPPLSTPMSSRGCLTYVCRGVQKRRHDQQLRFTEPPAADPPLPPREFRS